MIETRHDEIIGNGLLPNNWHVIKIVCICIAITRQLDKTVTSSDKRSGYHLTMYMIITVTSQPQYVMLAKIVLTASDCRVKSKI